MGNKRNVVAFSAPIGSGKTFIAHRLMELLENHNISYLYYPFAASLKSFVYLFFGVSREFERDRIEYWLKYSKPLLPPSHAYYGILEEKNKEEVEYQLLKLIDHLLMINWSYFDGSTDCPGSVVYRVKEANPKAWDLLVDNLYIAIQNGKNGQSNLLNSSLRKVYQILGTNVVRNTINPNFWVQATFFIWKNSGQKILIIDDVRFLNEASHILDPENHGILIYIDNPLITTRDTHESEKFFDQIRDMATKRLYNDPSDENSLEKLKGNLEKLIEELQIKPNNVPTL